LFAIGSHDLTLDVLAQYLGNIPDSALRRRLVSANVGSQGGLVALRRGEAHLAGSHLLDPATGRYNESYIRQYLPNLAVVQMGWVDRMQGLMVKRGNPKAITSLADLARKDVRFINRQRGAGTRVLLDYHLAQLEIAADAVCGYNQEEFTHLAVAAAVASDRADCGLGIFAAAQALDLLFIPLFPEQYDLIVPAVYFESDLFQPVRQAAQDPGFQKQVLAMPGYGVERMGTILARLEEA